MNELQLQAKCYQWFHNTYPKLRGRLRRIKNELDNHPRKTQRDKMVQLSENKATGVVEGDSDLYFIDTKNTYIELKVEKGVQSDAQKEFEALVKSFGHDYIIVRTFEEFKTLKLWQI